ncbi:MAG: F0F1 ATP synthase subunit epsilon [Proteobacteria bacterium]|nr:F0F1 ATP synthase subunit epsilon [Pseudomonadota bacterium]MDA1355451.1 F0F1 ATP synthase subunit epsilon [Pseudomonadota bacterium]
MADTFQFELVAPEKLIYSDDIEFVVVPGAEGDFGVLPGHSLLLSAVRPGIIEIFENDKPKERFFVGGGFAEVTPERCTILSTESVNLNDIDESAARQRLDTAERDLSDASSDAEREKCEKAIEVAQALLAACS